MYTAYQTSFFGTQIEIWIFDIDFLASGMPLYVLLLKGHALHLPLENSTSFPLMLVSGTYVVTHLECVRIDLNELIRNGFNATAVEHKNKGPRNNVAMSSTEQLSTHGPCDKNFERLWFSPKFKWSKCTKSTIWSCSKLSMEGLHGDLWLC